MPDNESPPPIANVTWSLLFGIGIIEALFAVVIVGGSWLIFRSGTTPADPAPIRQVLDDQVAAWNRGDLDVYMAGYWKSPELSFYSGNDVTKGWQPTLDRYRKRYQSEGKAMGQLSFADVHIEPLSQTQAIAKGRWKLTLPDGKTPEGLYTLLMKRVDGQWRVVHDHTSVAAP